MKMAASRLMASFPRLLAGCSVVIFTLLATSEAAHSGSGAGPTTDTGGNVPGDPSGQTCPYVCSCPDIDTGLFTCYEDTTIEVISFRSFGLSEMPTFIGEFTNLHTIDLSDNLLTNVPRNTFNKDSFPSLVVVYLQQNYIANLERESFATGDIEVVDLSSNVLQEIRFSAFDVGDSFRELNLQDNIIESVILDGTRLDRENYPSLTISLRGNLPPCDEPTTEGLRNSPYVPLCRDNFLENDGAMCRVPNSAATVDLTGYCDTVRSVLSGLPPQTQRPSPQTQRPLLPDTTTDGDSGGGGGGGGGGGFGGGGGGGGGGVTSNQQDFPQGAIIGTSVAVIVVVLMTLVTVLIIVCLCLKFKMWERKADSVAITQIEERLLGNRPYDYNKFLPLHSPSELIPSPRYVSAPRSPLPPIPGYPPGFQVSKGFPGPGMGGFPKLQEQDGSAGNPDSEEIYESIDENLFDEYESSYIYRVESVPERPANTSNAPLPKTPNETKEPVPSNRDSDAPSVFVEEAEVFINHATDAPSGQTVIRAEIHTSAVPPENKLCAKPEKISQAQSEKQPSDSEKLSDSKTAQPVVEERARDQKPVPTDIKVDIEDIEDKETTNTAGDVSTPEESSESTKKQSQDQTVTPAQNGNDSCTPMTMIVNADDSNGDTAEMIAQNANATEREKRLSALKDAWESQDKEDVAYLKIVL